MIVLDSPARAPVRAVTPPAVPLALGVYAVLLMALTLFKARLALPGLWSTAAHQQRSIDLQFFNGFGDAPLWWAPWLNALGNVALFVPFGFLLHVLLRTRTRSRWPLVEVVLLGAVLSLGIEVAQWVFAVGYTDVDDLLCNTLGALFGAAFAVALPRRWIPASATVLGLGCAAVLVLMLLSGTG